MELLSHNAEHVTVRFSLEELEIIRFVLADAHRMDKFIRGVSLEEVEDLKTIISAAKQSDLQITQRQWGNILGVLNACCAAPSPREERRIEEIKQVLEKTSDLVKIANKSVQSLIERLANDS